MLATFTVTECGGSISAKAKIQGKLSTSEIVSQLLQETSCLSWI